jgi:hypothetical protein
MITNAITFLTAVGELHTTGMFMMSMPHNDRLTEEEYNACYMEITGTTDDGTAITSDDVSAFTVTYADAVAKYDELIAAE